MLEVHCIQENLGRAMQKRVFWHMDRGKTQISLRICSLIRGLCCFVIEPLDTAECMNGEQRPEWYFDITKTCLYNFDPLKPYFYIVKLGFTGVYIIFHISAQKIECGHSLEPPHWGSSNEYHNLWKISEFLSENFHFFGGYTSTSLWHGSL